MFWAREMPSDGSPLLLGARVTGREANESDTVVVDAESGETRRLTPDEPRGHRWVHSLEIPAVCVD